MKGSVTKPGQGYSLSRVACFRFSTAPLDDVILRNYTRLACSCCQKSTLCRRLLRQQNQAHPVLLSYLTILCVIERPEGDRTRMHLVPNLHPPLATVADALLTCSLVSAMQRPTAPPSVWSYDAARISPIHALLRHSTSPWWSSGPGSFSSTRTSRFRSPPSAFYWVLCSRTRSLLTKPPSFLKSQVNPRPTSSSVSVLSISCP